MCVCALALAEGSGYSGVVLGIYPVQEAQARSPGPRSNTDKEAISVRVFLSFPSRSFCPVVSAGSVCQIWGAWSEGSSRPVVGLVPVVGLFSNVWRRSHVQGALLHQPEVHFIYMTYKFHSSPSFSCHQLAKQMTKWFCCQCGCFYNENLTRSLGQKAILKSCMSQNPSFLNT